MKSNWETTKLRNVCKFEKNNNNGRMLPYVGMEDIESHTGKFMGSLEPRSVKSSTFYFTPEHLLYGRLRPYLNKVLLPTFEGHCSTEIFPIRVNRFLDKRYLFYWISSDNVVQKINHTCTGARMPRANMNEVLEFDIPLPPLPEQKRIVKILDEAFAAIDRAKAIIEKNYLNSEELHSSLINNILYKDQDKWNKSNLAQSCEFWNGKAHERHIDEQGKYIVVNSKFISSEGAIKKYTNEQMFPLYKGDITMVMSDVPKGRSLAKCYLIEEDNLYSLNQRICAIRSENFVKKYLFYQLNRHHYLLSFDNGENQTNLRKGEILKTPLMIPPIETQQLVVEKLDELVSYAICLANNYQKKLKNLEELKKSILQKAFDGQLKSDN